MTRDPFNIEVGARIRRRRNLERLEIKQIAADTGVQVSAISRVERGRRGASLKTLVKLARALQCTTDELLGLAPERTVPQ